MRSLGFWRLVSSLLEDGVLRAILRTAWSLRGGITDKLLKRASNLLVGEVAFLTASSDLRIVGP